ncbi:hypothetical protein MASR1M60_14410 [Rhodocyclaceae bacterium]
MRKDSELSALYDGELEDHEVASIVRSALVDEKQMADWQAYALIGDQLRGVQGQGYRPDFVENVMVCVREEPQVLAPRNLARPSSRHPLLALAASVAGVAVVGWLVLAGPQQAAGPQIAYVAVPPAPTFAKADLNNKSVTPQVQPVRADRADRAEMGEYLVAHHAHASALHLGEGVQHVRSVSMTGDAGRP